MKLLLFILLLPLFGCATTKQVLLATEDQTGASGSDIFLKFHYAYVDNSEIIVCADVLRQQKNILDNKHHFGSFSYEFALPIKELENIAHSNDPLYSVRESYNIKRNETKECNSYSQPPNTQSVTITTINNNEFYKTNKDKPNLKQTDFDKIALQGKPEELLYTSYRQLLYITHSNNLIKIKTEPPVTEGNIAAYLLVPFTAIYDIIAFPFRAIGGALYTHGS